MKINSTAKNIITKCPVLSLSVYSTLLSRQYTIKSLRHTISRNRVCCSIKKRESNVLFCVFRTSVNESFLSKTNVYCVNFTTYSNIINNKTKIFFKQIFKQSKRYSVYSLFSSYQFLSDNEKSLLNIFVRWLWITYRKVLITRSL